MLISSSVTNSARSTMDWEPGENDKGDFPPMGLMYIAGYLRQNASHHVIEIIDANLLRYTQEDIKNEITRFQPDIVGMTVLTTMLYDCLETIKTVKNVSKDIYVAVGGAHPNNHINETMDFPEVDFICLGEGEILFAELLDALDGKRELSTVDGLVYRDNNKKVVRNKGYGFVKDLDSVPLPAFDLVPFQKYYSMIGTGDPTGVLCSSRGCPYRCTYCSKLFSNYRGRSPQNIIEEMRLYYNEGIREFMFFDDMFNVNAKRAINIAKAIKENFIDIEWSFRGRADQINDELGNELRESHCTQVTLGAEAHTDEIQKELKTGKSVKEIKNAVRILRKNKIKANTNWIIGLPQHKSAKDIKAMLKVLLDIDSDYAQFAILMLYDDTELYKEALERKIVDKKIWDEHIKNPVPRFLIPAWEEYMSLEEQGQLLRYCWTRFYLRPKVIYRNLMDLRDWNTFKTKLKGFFLMLSAFFHPVLRLIKKAPQTQ